MDQVNFCLKGLTRSCRPLLSPDIGIRGPSTCMHMLAMLTSHYNLVNAEPVIVTLSSPELDGMTEIYFLLSSRSPYTTAWRSSWGRWCLWRGALTATTSSISGSGPAVLTRLTQERASLPCQPPGTWHGSYSVHSTQWQCSGMPSFILPRWQCCRGTEPDIQSVVKYLVKSWLKGSTLLPITVTEMTPQFCERYYHTILWEWIAPLLEGKTL